MIGKNVLSAESRQAEILTAFMKTGNLPFSQSSPDCNVCEESRGLVKRRTQTQWGGVKPETLPL